MRILGRLVDGSMEGGAGYRRTNVDAERFYVLVDGEDPVCVDDKVFLVHVDGEWFPVYMEAGEWFPV